MRIAIAAAVACLSIVGITANAQVQAAIRQHTEIPPEPLDLALRTLAKDRGFQVVYLTEDVRALKTPGAVGDLTIDEALKKLLSDSRLEYKFVDENTVSVFAVPASAATSAAADQSQTTQNISTQGGGKQSSQEFRLAQVDQAPAGPQAVGVDQNSDKKKKKEDELTEIVVTGTNIRGSSTTTSPIIQYDRASIDRSGYLNTQDFVQSIPQAFGGGAYGASPDGMLGGGAGATLNFEHASAVNLRGLGENSTLVLLNGHRLAPSTYGNVVDISTIPLSAIDHIDVLTDGASAIYGADAVAGVVNIVLRKGFDGAETQATYGGASGGLRDEIFGQTFGKEWSTGSIMASYQYQHDSTLPTSARSFTAGAPQPTNLINPFTENSLVVNGNQRIIDGLTLSGDVLTTWKSTRSDTTYGATSAVRAFSSDLGVDAHLGLAYALNDRWVLDLNGVYSRQRANIGFDYDDGFDVPLGRTVQTITAPTTDVTLNLSGQPFELPGGDVGLAVGFEHREESGGLNYDPAFVSGEGLATDSLSVNRHVNSEYAELRLPFLSPENNIPLVAKLVASVAIRHDAYSDFGGTTNPKFGLLWSPVSFLDVKANWSRAFRAPSVGELIANVGPDQVAVYPPIFPTPSGSNVAALFLFGANQNLQPETATTYDLGFDLRVPNIEGLKVTVDYYDVDFKNRIETPPQALNFLLYPNIYGQLITSFSSDAAAAAYVAGLEAKGYQLTDLGFGTSVAGVRAAYPLYLINAAVVRQNGLDITTHYAFDVERESFQTGLNAAFINHIDTQLAPGATPTNLVNTYANPMRLRLRWDGAWVHGPATISAAVNYTNAYTNPFITPPSSIASFTTVDFTGAIELAKQAPASLLHGTVLRLNVTNAFDRYPPYAAGASALLGINYDVGNASPIGRMISIQLLKKW